MSVTEALNVSLEKTFNIKEQYIELMPTWGYALSAMILFLIGFFGFFLNLIVIVLMYKDKQLWTPLNVILFNLVCSDFSVSIMGNPFTLISALHHRWIFGKTMCVFYGFFMTLLGITSITTLTVLSFERYIMVSRPLASHRLSMRSAGRTVCLIWCYSLMVTSPPLFGWGRFVNEAANISCSINWEEQTLNALTYILFLFIMGLIFPVMVITYSYINILKTMKKNALRMGRVAKAESKVTIMVFIMIVTFMIAWTPYSILALTEQFAPPDLVSPALGVIPALIAKSSICYDPIIYVGMNTQFRASVKRIFGFGNSDEMLQDRGVENTLMSPTKPFSHVNDDNNITLQYLNPKNNTVVAVTIYQDQHQDMKREIEKASERTNNIVDKNNKIVLEASSYEENSSEISTESIIKDSSSHDVKSHKVLKFSTNQIGSYSEESDLLLNTKPTGDGKDLNHQCEDDSKDLLLKESNSKKCGIDNIASGIWDCNDTKIFAQSNIVCKKEDARKTISLRRKSMIQTRVDLADVRMLADYRRKSSGQTKYAVTSHESRGTVISRITVDERDRTKLLAFKEIRENIGATESEQLL